MVRRRDFMSQLHLSAEDSFTATSVSNIFIDYYMPLANGNFVKVYLCLLRCLCQTPESFSISYLADQLEETEKDITRALKYWEKVRLVALQAKEDGTISSISLLAPQKPEDRQAQPQTRQRQAKQRQNEQSQAEQGQTGLGQTAAQPLARQTPIPDHPDYTTEQIAALSKNEEVKWIVTIIENYLSRPLRQRDLHLIFYLYDSLHFSAELIFYLYEYCISRGKKSCAYIETVAIAWAEQDVSTVEEAENASIQYNTSYAAVIKAFGFSRMPGAAERRYIDHWVSEFGFSNEIITEACNRALLNTQKQDFKYANRVLSNWHRDGVTCMADIQKLDKQFTASKATQIAPPETQPKVPNRFHAFPQRNYSKEDYSHIEKELLRRPLKA